VESSYLAPQLVEMLSGAVDRLMKHAAHTAATAALRGDNAD